MPVSSIEYDKPGTQLIRRTLVVVSIGTSLFVMFIAALGILGFTVSSYPRAAILLLPWTLGMYGVIGLARSWPDAATKPAASLQKDVVLLGLGVVGATIFATFWLATLKSYGGNLSVTRVAMLVVFATAFPLLPIAFASIRIYKSVTLMRRTKPADKPKMGNFYLTLLLGWLAVVAARILPQEAIMMWYGRDLVSAAYQAADKLANGRPYCVMGFGGTDAFEQMDKRRLLLSAIEKSAGFSNRNGGTFPHFGIALKDGVYWWSFKRREFLPLVTFPDYELPPARQCDALEP